MTNHSRTLSTNDRIRETRRKASDRVSDAKDAVVNGAGATLASVRDAALEKAEDTRETLAEVGDRLAATLEAASGKDADDVLKSQLMTSVAQGLSQASDALRQRSITELGADLRTLARRHPGAFMAGAAVLGFAAARLVRASSRRRLAMDDQAAGPRG